MAGQAHEGRANSLPHAGKGRIVLAGLVRLSARDIA